MALSLLAIPGVGAGVNGDGDLDAVFTNEGVNRWCLGDGAGFGDCSNVSSDSNSTIGMALGDVNGDGNLDAVFANFSQENRLCLGDGTDLDDCEDVSDDTIVGRGVGLTMALCDGNVPTITGAGWRTRIRSAEPGVIPAPMSIRPISSSEKPGG